jgi:F-type H+-transporting ATPase subunit b
MSIDWFTVVAQSINFVILIWLLKRFLYKPILSAIDAREKWIATELADADAKEAAAVRQRDELKGQNDALEKRCEAVLSQAVVEANVERLRLVEEARQTAEAMKTKQQEALRTEAQDLSQALSRRTEQEVFAVARKALADLAAATLEERMTEVLVRRLRALEGSPKDRLGEALRTASAPALLRSAFDLPTEQRAAIQQAIEEAFVTPVRLRFEIAPELICGIELTTGGQRVSWNLADYLASLQRGVTALLQEKIGAAAPTAEATRP